MLKKYQKLCQTRYERFFFILTNLLLELESLPALGVVYPSVVCSPLSPPPKNFFWVYPLPGRSKRGLAFGAEKSEKSEKEGWNHEKRAKTAKIWLEIIKRGLELARGLDPPP